MALTGQNINTVVFNYVTDAYTNGRGPNLLTTLQANAENSDYPGATSQVAAELVAAFEVATGETENEFYWEAATTAMEYIEVLLQAQIGKSDVGAKLPDVGVTKVPDGADIENDDFRLEIRTTDGLTQVQAQSFDFSLFWTRNGVQVEGTNTVQVPASRSKDLAKLFWYTMGL